MECPVAVKTHAKSTLELALSVSRLDHLACVWSKKLGTSWVIPGKNDVEIVVDQECHTVSAVAPRRRWWNQGDGDG